MTQALSHTAIVAVGGGFYIDTFGHLLDFLPATLGNAWLSRWHGSSGGLTAEW
jgi:hypothetical protein